MTLISTILQAPTSLKSTGPDVTTLLIQLATPAVRTLALAGAAGLGLTVFRVKAASVRLFTWTAVLYAALAMPLLGWMLPPLAVPMPSFLIHEDVRSSGVVTVSAPDTTIPSATEDSSPAAKQAITKHISSSPAGQAQLYSAQALALSPAASSFQRSMGWSAVVAGVYLAVALLLLVRLIVALALGHRLMKGSQRILDPRVTRKLRERARCCGLVDPPIAESELISVPVTMGALRSTILLPPAWSEWDEAKLDAVLAHELSHVARRDAFTQRLSLLHRAIFWFSPLAWWLDRHLADLAEEASDEAALSSGADRNQYARTLLGFFETVQAAPGRVWWQGVSMGKAGQAEERVERILAWKGAVTMGLKKSLAVAIVALAIPAIYLAASVRPVAHNQESQRPELAHDQAPSAPGTAVAPSASPNDSVLPPSEAAPAAMNAAPAAVQPTLPSPAAQANQSSSSSSSGGTGYSYAYGYDDEQRFVIVTGKTDSLTMSGSTDDAHHVEKLRKRISGDFIWFQRDEKSYIIRDQATIDRARKLWAPQEELGKRQEELGKQQEALGKQQEALGSRMEQVRVNVPDLTAELEKLKAEMKQLSSGATVEQVGRLQSEIGQIQSQIGELQSKAGEEQSKLGEQQGALGEKQGELGRQQGELGRQQGELAREATHRMKELLDEAIKNGTAQPEAETPGGSASL